MLNPLPFHVSPWERTLIRIAALRWMPLPTAPPRRDWPPSPLFEGRRFRKVGRFWVHGPVPGTPVERAVVREGPGDAFGGVYLESHPRSAAQLLVWVVRDRALLPPFAQPNVWLRNYPDRHPGHALCAREAGWLFSFYIDTTGRGVFFSRRTSLDPAKNHPPQLRALRSCRPPVFQNRRARQERP